ncbi:MAG: energy transducer TonB [Lutibacter sp.]|nr:energy transducer TonB [Lutibacter sp.]
MNFLDTKYKRQSAAITSVLMLLLLIALFFFGLRYLDPPIEYGIAVNFGTSDVGMGDVQPTEPLKSASEEVVEQQEEKVEQQVVTKATTATVSENVVTQNIEDAIAIQKKQEAQKKADELARVEKIKKDAIAKQKAAEAANRKKLDALIGGFNNSNGKASGGEGNDNVPGDKGKTTGDPNAKGYYGNGGNGGGGDYQLGNRKPIIRPEPEFLCDEDALVVVRIEVDRNGKVIKASPDRGTTAIKDCTIKEAIKAALETTWEPSKDGEIKQVGTIKYTFRLK